MRSLLVASLAVVILITSPTLAASDRHEELSVASEKFDAQREDILERLGSKTYSEISDEDRDAVLQALSRMAEKLGDVESVDQLKQSDRVDVFNDQELINNLLTSAARDSRMVCKRDRFIGSNRPTVVCQTVAERRRIAETTREEIRMMQQTLMTEESATPGSY